MPPLDAASTSCMAALAAAQKAPPEPLSLLLPPLLALSPPPWSAWSARSPHPPHPGDASWPRDFHGRYRSPSHRAFMSALSPATLRSWWARPPPSLFAAVIPTPVLSLFPSRLSAPAHQFGPAPGTVNMDSTKQLSGWKWQTEDGEGRQQVESVRPQPGLHPSHDADAELHALTICLATATSSALDSQQGTAQSRTGLGSCQ